MKTMETLVASRIESEEMQDIEGRQLPQRGAVLSRSNIAAERIRVATWMRASSINMDPMKVGPIRHRLAVLVAAVVVMTDATAGIYVRRCESAVITGSHKARPA